MRLLAADHSPSMKLKCLPRNQPWASKDEENSLCIMSWNVLAPTLAETWPGQREFREERLAALLEVLDLYASCDIVCLQELEVGISLELVQSFLEEKGFDVAVQDREGHPVINATFFRRSLLRLSWVISRSRILLTGLLLPSGHEVSVMNVHLDSKQQDQRAAQLTKSLQKMSMARSTYQVVCGDFNTNLALDTHLSDLLAEHRLFRTPTKGFTHSLGSALDHLCSTQHLAPRRVLQPASQHHLQGLPNKECPSDHLPVAATFELLLPQWQCPALPVARLPPQLLMEWSELLALGLRSNSSKKARKEQKQLEESFLSSTSPDLSLELTRWRDARREAAQAICRRAVEQALVLLRAMPTREKFAP